MDIQPVSGALGAEVSGVRLAGTLTDDQQTEIRAAFAQHHVLFFRNQSLEPQQQLRAAALFGEPDVYPFIEGMEGFPKVIEIIKTEADNRNFGGAWHSDTAYLPKPALGTMLYAVEVPSSGGDTMFANTSAAYEALSGGMRAMLEPLIGVNDSDKGYGGSRASVLATLDSMGANYKREASSFRSEHPIVRTHPHSGKKGLYLSRSHTLQFKGMTVDESTPLIHFLCDHITRPEFSCRFQWLPGSVAVWDNRITQHYAVNDYGGARRHMRRVTLKGETPV